MRLPGRTALRVTASAIGIALALMASVAAFAQFTERTAEALDERVWELRAQAEYAAAAVVARELLTLLEGHTEANPFEIADARRSVEILEHIASLPEGTRRELGTADGLTEVDRRLWGEGRYVEAAEAVERQLEIRRRLLGGDHHDVALSLNDLAADLYAQGDHAGAEPLYREALVMLKELLGGEHPYVAGGLNNLALLLAASGDYAGAEPLLRKALAINRALLGDEHPYVAFSLSSLASLLSDQGDYVGAESLYRETLAMRRAILGDEHPQVARSLSNLAVLLHTQGDYAGAEPLHREALAMRRKTLGDEHPDVATSMNSLAHLLDSRRDHVGAEHLFRDALAMRRSLLGDEHPDVAASLSGLAQSLYAQDDYAGAEPFFREALAMRMKLLGDEHPSVARSLGDLAMDVEAQGDLADAESLLEEAARVFDAARLRAGAGLERAAFQASPYPRLASVRLALGRTSEAWPAAEKSHARALADLLTVAGERGISPSESAREDSLNNALGTLERELAAYREAAMGDTTREAAGLAEAARNKLLAAESEWSAFQRDVALRHPVTEGETFPLERVQSALPEHAAIIGWLDVETRRGACESWCYVVRSAGPVAWARAGNPDGDEGSVSPFDRASSFRRDLADPASTDIGIAIESSRLWNDRIGPFVETLAGVENLIVVPSGAMLGVPVEVLVDDEGRHVGETYAVSYVPSATIYTWLAERTDSNVGGGTLLVGDPPYNATHLSAMEDEDDVFLASVAEWPSEQTLRGAVAGNADALRTLPRLHGARREIAAIARVCEPSSLLLGAEASERRLVGLAESGELGEFGTIHIATHAIVDDERPERSALVLSQVELPDPLEAAVTGARIYDGLVTADEIVREWNLTADLVTLSACETGLGREIMGEGYVGFAHAFLQAGARSLLVSLWKVEDEATSLLMRRFYENRVGESENEGSGGPGRPMHESEALAEAKSWLRKYVDGHGNRPYDHPYFWSAFILIGDPS